ncbi:hypothetical protein JA1_001596 [Spathaspora sp. JA1]|nr:hypothetical protein JA1_001596 [Spathaspora sp. JA1]
MLFLNICRGWLYLIKSFTLMYFIWLIEQLRTGNVGIKQKLSNNKLTIMELPDHLLVDILNKLNQFHVCRICTVNRRLYMLGKAKLYRSIYVNNCRDLPIQISAMTYTPFYLKYTIVNKSESQEWLHENSNIKLIKSMIFRLQNGSLENARYLYPWIDTVIDYESAGIGSYIVKQNRYSTKFILSQYNSIPVLYQSQSSPWVTKLTVHIHVVEDEKLLAIASLCGLSDLKHLPIQNLLISFDADIERNISIKELKNVFNLQNLITLELHFWFLNKYPDHFEHELLDIFSGLTNIKHLSLISGNIQFDRLIGMLKPNSLYSLHLRIAEVGKVVTRFQMDDILKHQEGSLQRLYLGNNAIQGGRFYGLQEFDRIYKVKCRKDDSQELLHDLRQIRITLFEGTAYSQLNQIILNDCCYLIRRHSKENIYIIPCNTLMFGIPETENSPYVLYDDKLTIMSLPDHLLVDILSHLNQIHICHICTFNRRLYFLGKAKLYSSIYVNNCRYLPIQISSMTYTPFYIKYTIVNKWRSLECLQEDSSVELIKSMTFRWKDNSFDDARLLYPWIDTVIDYEAGRFLFPSLNFGEQNHCSTKLVLDNKSSIPESNQSRPLNLVTKLTVQMKVVEDEKLLAIEGLCGLTELKVLGCNENRLDKLLPIGLSEFPIKNLFISFAYDLEKNISIKKLKDIFNLQNLTTL